MIKARKNSAYAYREELLGAGVVERVKRDTLSRDTLSKGYNWNDWNDRKY